MRERVKKTTQRHKFLRGNPIWKNHGEEGENSLFSGGYSELNRAKTMT